jgi:hypothetical protein
VEVERVRLDSPVELLHPAVTAAGQFASERVAFGAPNGVNEPATFAFLTTMFAMLAAPLTLNAGAWVHNVGFPPDGVVQIIFKLPGAGAGRAEPLNIVAQLLADPAMLNLSVPEIVPRAMVPEVVIHGLAELPRAALTTIVSVLAVPPFMRAGVNRMTPFQAPLVALHLTVPGKLTGEVDAEATLDTMESDTRESSVAVETKRRILRAIRAPASF